MTRARRVKMARRPDVAYCKKNFPTSAVTSADFLFGQPRRSRPSAAYVAARSLCSRGRATSRPTSGWMDCGLPSRKEVPVTSSLPSTHCSMEQLLLTSAVATTRRPRRRTRRGEQSAAKWRRDQGLPGAASAPSRPPPFAIARRPLVAQPTGLTPFASPPHPAARSRPSSRLPRKAWRSAGAHRLLIRAPWRRRRRAAPSPAPSAARPPSVLRRLPRWSG